MKRIGKLYLVALLIIINIALAESDKEGIPSTKPAVDFFQEEITLIVNDSISRVEGVYHFKNNTLKNLNLPLIFPFYADSVTAFPHMIEVFYIDSTGERRSLKYQSRPERNIIRLAVPIAPQSNITWYLNYEQKISAGRAVYIITSTSAWSKPLDQATYTYITPKNFNIINIWPQPDTSYQDSLYTYRQCTQHNFLPEREMEIRWR